MKKKPDASPWQAVICGVGGQGVLFINHLLARAALAAGMEVMVSEVHGMAQRGGSVISHLRVGPFHSPLAPLGGVDLLFALEKYEAVRNIAYLRLGGKLAVNARNINFFSAEAQKALLKHKIEVFYKDVDSLALKNKTTANILLLAATARSGCLPLGEARLTGLVRQLYPEVMPAWELGTDEALRRYRP
jgi:indolepyruvate ferredoxin oxidoreductase beta subunit